ncbi:ImmA/IrrE family metallo-endopeptidase [Clostridium botulinum]|uniref:helix-turn-helix domain-containing protein n=1 Tax=Clostridium botulinum TaxID=1491 RepID=UPI000585E223|nr:XRE family transcriptional regulator [Clostridium botulinum]AJD28007.1 helix-turn-helix family protein [Clostridium botulinum CDC_297]MBY6878404.1 ImmA/IrrE family metallo-endopeptidase [Clostridium botulinum]MBY6892027.1 ImmA/IrrE family metallo-endopeptidase [Clostridium botulinum]MBY6894461.1 ImmA/IrrE family metallo-endopeptidase [Clostridium botulinum]MBY6901647.1 ImmA/IrrE family metallo-endopeptidase [Clostridium botulinum]
MLRTNNYKNKFNGERLKSARKYRCKSMTDLAKDIGVSRQTISQYENGLIFPQFDILIKLINSLGFPREYFYESDDTNIELGNTYFRSSSRMTKKEENAQKEKTKIIGKVFLFLNEYIEFPKLNIPQFDEDMSIEDMTLKLREHWGLGKEPIKDMIYLLEKNGIIITSMNTTSENIDAFTQQQNINGEKHFLIVLGNDKDSATRRQFSLAHELGHIIMHDAFLELEDLTKEELRDMEKEAHAFAAAFLLPKENFIKDISIYPTNLNYYKELKKKWRTSISAMLVRANQVGIITNSSYQTLNKKINRLGWRKKEPLDDTLMMRNPTVLKRSVDIILDNDILNEDEIIKELSNRGLTLRREEIELLLGLDEGKLISKVNNDNVIQMALKN